MRVELILLPDTLDYKSITISKQDINNYSLCITKKYKCKSTMKNNNQQNV